jgi:uncharacterized protein YjeT (DUF2065 family)
MIFSRIILIIISSMFFVCGVIITIIPEKVKNWLKECSELPTNLFCLTGYILGLIGLVILIITFVG